MKFQIVSAKIGKDGDTILKSYKAIEECDFVVKGRELFVIINSLEELMDLISKKIKQNCFICHDENVIHIYDDKLK